jgi:Na+-driven multidrug efflux pump
MFESGQMSGFQILANGGRIRLCSLVMGIEAALNLFISLLLIKSLGVVGVAIGTVIPQVLRSGIFYPLFLSKFTGVGLDRYFKKVLLIAIYKFCGLHSGRLSLLALGLLVAPCELAGMYFFCLTDAQKLQLHQKLASTKLAGKAVMSFFSS